MGGGGGDRGNGGAEGAEGGDGSDGGGAGGRGGTGQAVWQTYLRCKAQGRSFHLPGPPAWPSQLNTRQSSS